MPLLSRTRSIVVVVFFCCALASFATFALLSESKTERVGISPVDVMGVTGTPTASPTCDPAWSAGPTFPAVGVVRAVGNYFAANGRFYSMGGRSSDTAGNNFTQPFEFNPSTNAWTIKSATFPDDNVNNMACGVLTASGTPQIYCVGGSAGGGTTATARVFSYNPVTDTLTALTSADDWPENPPSPGNVLPGGFAVVNNKLYTIGAFMIAPATMRDTVWEFDPNAAVGSRWTLKASLPIAKGYVPATVIGGAIYVAGGATINGTTLEDTFDSFKYDTVTNTWTAITNIPRATGETRAVTIAGEMWVLGGGRTDPNPSNEVDIYNPATNTWRTGPAFTLARRNFPADTDGSRIWLAGGYDFTNTLLNDMEIFGPAACGTPTSTPTNTSTTTPTATATATVSATPTASPTCNPNWSPGPVFPAVGVVRAVGNYFPANGRFYSIGGRSSDTAGNHFTHPFEFDPVANAWTMKSATFPDTNVSNMACGVLTAGGTPQIYCVGGSAGGGVGATARVFSYDPVTDTLTSLTAADDWPGNPPSPGNILPGGFAVANNKLYTIGAFMITPATMLSDVWEFDPNAAVGSRWTAKAGLPIPKGYVPATVIGGSIYVAGGAMVNGATLDDSVDSFKYDITTNTWTAIANIPRPTGETRAVTIDGEMWVLGGGRTAPNPSNEVDIYNPGTNTWRTGPPFTTGRRNFPADTDGSRIWIAGGYDAANVLLNDMEIYAPTGCATATPTNTPTGTPSASPTCTPGLNEGFDDIATLVPAGWNMQNLSSPRGTSDWFQGNPDVFPSQSGAPDSYIAANFNNGADIATISNWLLTPEVGIQNGAVLTFWTRTIESNIFPDRLQVRLSTNGSSVDIGTTATSVGDFTTLLLDINPTYQQGGYPEVWTQYTLTITGVPTATTGRLAFRYFVEEGGPNGANSNYIGIDTVQYTGICGTPTPTSTATPSPSPTCGPSNWTFAASFPYIVEDSVVSSDGSFAYAAGGYDGTGGGEFRNTMYRYDPSTNGWSALANMPLAMGRGESAYSPVTNSVYVFGGSSQTNPNLNTTFIYNIGTNTWTTGSPMPEARSWLNAAYYAANNKIYVIGGVVSGGTGIFEQNQVWEYDPVANTWDTSRQSAPVGLGGSTEGIIGQYIYIAGGYGTAGGGTTNHYRYDILNNTWVSLAPLPFPNFNPVGASVGGKNYVIGGGNPFNGYDASFNTTLSYDPATNVWTNGPSTNVAHSYGSGTAIGNRLLIFGGYTGSSGTNIAEINELGVCPTPTATTTSTSTSTPTASATPTFTPTATSTINATQTPSPDPTTTPTPTATSASTSTPTNTPTATATATATPTATATSPPPSIQFSSPTYEEDESQTAMITITRTGDLSGTDTAIFMPSDGTAMGGVGCHIAGVDYALVPNPLVVFNPGDTMATAILPLCGDGLTESDETVNLALMGDHIGTPSTAVLTINDTASRFRNPANITINQNGAGDPYPSQITISNGPFIIGSMRVTLYDLNANIPDDVDIMLVSPGGRAFVLTANAGGPSQIAPVTINFSDTAGQVIPDNGPLVTDDFEPTSYGSVAAFPPPAPANFNLPGSTIGGTGTQTLRGNFGGTNANGVWSLYVRNDTPAVDPLLVVGNIAGGWGIEFLGTTEANAYISGRVTTADGRGIRNARITISGDSLSERRVVTTGSLGYFSVDGLQTGETYVVTVNSQRFTFSTPSRVISLVDNVVDANFVADP